jgi:hypothetical protein
MNRLLAAIRVALETDTLDEEEKRWLNDQEASQDL